MGGVDNEGFEEEDKIDQKFSKKGKNTKYKNTKGKNEIIEQKRYIIEIQRIETARYSNMAYFPGEFFLYIFEN